MNQVVKEQAAQDTERTSSSSQPNFVEIEHRILEHWSKNGTFEKLKKNVAGKPLFRFLDGPITANNPMGVHHAWGRTLKDIFIRYKTLNGFDSHFQNGFDCQGLWVEVEVERDLGFKGKPDIEAFGLDKFSAACKARIDKYSGIQTSQSVRLGQWMDWGHSYYTHTDTNIQGIWKFLKTCHSNGWLYRSHLPMPWCTRCGTSLSEHEMSGSYKTMKHLAVYLKLLIPELKARILVWTTTPWTLPANTALAVNPELDYAFVEVQGEDLPLILSSQVAAQWMNGGWKNRSPRILKQVKGTELVGLAYEAIFHELPVQQGFAHSIVPWSDVDPSEGTGVVHIAPGCGLEDFELSKTITLERIIPVDEKGEYVAGYGDLQGKNAKDVAEDVASWLSSQGKLYSKYLHEHSYPVCWRCKDELIFRLVDEWYISSAEIRPKLMAAAAEVTWQPNHVGKRMEDWLRNMGDWCISRKRFWGLPLPFYVCGACSHVTVVESRQELQSLTDQDVSSVPELHRPWIDAIKIRCPKCSSTVTRVAEVGDCWLDAGIVPYSTAACYGRQSDGSRGAWQPADFICEMSEQVRLWFYSMLFMGVTLGGRAPYKHVLTYERVLAEDGTKFSKTGYMIKFDEAAERMGVDTMRYYFASQPPTSDIRFGFAQGDETRRQLISLWNILSFFNTYAGIDLPSVGSSAEPPAALLPIDRWLLASTHSFVAEATRGFESFDTPVVVRACERYVDGLSNWYIRSNRRRFWKSESDAEKSSGYWTLFQAVRTLSQIMAPIIPFVAEHMWQDCIRRFDSSAEDSVHLASWPRVPEHWKDEALVANVDKVRAIITLAHRLRTESKVKVRQPLRTLYVCAPEDWVAAAGNFEESITSELNVKELRILGDKAELFSHTLELDLKKAGPVLKGDIQRVVALVNSLQGAEASQVIASIQAGREAVLPGWSAPLPATIFVLKPRLRPDIVAAEEQKLFVALDTRLSPELEDEGWVRDILRQSQLLRKESGLEVQDRIYLSLVTESADLRRVIETYRSFIESETLGALSLEPLAKPLGSVEVPLQSAQREGGAVRVSLAKRDA